MPKFIKSRVQKNENIVKSLVAEIPRGGNAVENYDGVLQYICANRERSIQLTTYLKEKLTQIFGKHNATFRGEFFFYVWVVEFEGETFNIYTASRKGTQFSIFAKYEENKSKVCIKFLKKMEELLK